ncbi:MAG: hydrolase 2, exosortase A system-associated [Gammaproteobacteria bacterium]|nr:hydrolase 2, exosortase A system-associated [Gammaproteobacteria bacterium]
MLIKPRLFFLNTAHGKLFITQFVPELEQKIRLNVIVIAPFAEEANKSRKMLADFARQAAQHHIRVSLIDLFGTGDSEGDFSQASWDIWQQNIRALYLALQRQDPDVAIGLIGLRSGALLALDCYCNQLISPAAPLVLLQPALNGKQFMVQFMRLRLAAGMINAKAKLTMADLQQELLKNGGLEIAGYHLNHGLSEAIAQLNYLDLKQLPDSLSLAWVEIGQPPTQQIKAISKKTIANWQKFNDVTEQFIVGDSFWQTQEITQVPELSDYCISYLLGGLNA